MQLAIRFHNTFGDTPVATPESERVNLASKVTSAVWPGHLNVEEYVSQDEEGNLCLKSVDENASIVLSKDGFHFTVSFLVMMPGKKPQWQEVADDGDSSLRSILNQSVCTSRSEKRMRMVYEYMRATQVHSINRFPPRWCYPLSLLLHYRPDLALPPQFSCHFHSATPCYSELLRGKEYSTELPLPSDSKLQSVWQDDEVSPASYLTSHKQSNLMLLWTP